MTVAVCSTLAVLSIARAEHRAGEPRVLEFVQEISGDFTVALKTIVPILEPDGTLCPTADDAIARVLAAGFVAYTEERHVPTAQLAIVLLRYPAIGKPTATVRVSSGKGTTAYPLATFRA